MPRLTTFCKKTELYNMHSTNISDIFEGNNLFGSNLLIQPEYFVEYTFSGLIKNFWL